MPYDVLNSFTHDADSSNTAINHNSRQVQKNIFSTHKWLLSKGIQAEYFYQLSLSKMYFCNFYTFIYIYIYIRSSKDINPNGQYWFCANCKQSALLKYLIWLKENI